jgi:hypothetical protein
MRLIAARCAACLDHPGVPRSSAARPREIRQVDPRRQTPEEPQRGCKRCEGNSGFQTVLARPSSLFVAQHLAGGGIDQMQAATSRADHRLIAVGSLGRLRVGQPHLRVHAHSDTAENEFTHLITLARRPPVALTCLKPARSCARPAQFSGPGTGLTGTFAGAPGCRAMVANGGMK